MSDDLQMIYDKLEQESNQAKEGGYVHIELFGDKSNNFKKLILEGTIKSDTIIFNNTLNIKAELNENWEIKASKSWCKKYFYGKQN